MAASFPPQLGGGDVSADPKTRAGGLSSVAETGREHERLHPWLLAVRPRTLTAAVAPVLVGSATALRDGGFDLLPALAALAGALLIQTGTNFANDVDDFERGADTAARRGPLRVTQSGLLPAQDVRRAAWGAFGAAAAIGLYLVAHAGWPIAALGVAAIAAGWAYTGGPSPLGYLGLGDLLVFVFFGLAAVVGTHYVQTGTTGGLVWALAIPIGTLATAILVVNNVRDSDSDRDAGKRTLVVRLGERFGRAEYGALLAAAYLVPVFLWVTGTCGPFIMLPLLAAPRAFDLALTMMRCTDAADFNAALGGTARLHGEFAVLLAAGVLLAG